MRMVPRDPGRDLMNRAPTASLTGYPATERAALSCTMHMSVSLHSAKGGLTQITPRSPGAAAAMFGICVVGARGGVYGVGDCGRVHDHERGKAVVLALRGLRPGGAEAQNRGECHGPGPHARGRCAEGRTNLMDRRGAIATTSPRPAPQATTDGRSSRMVCARGGWPATLPRRGGLSLRLGDELREPEHRQPA